MIDATSLAAIRTATDSFNADSLAAVYAVHGSAIKLNNVDGTGCYTAPRWTEKLAPDGGGFRRVITSSLRLRKADWPNYKTEADFIKKEIQLRQGDGWQRFGLADEGVVDIHLGGEWKLELEALT